MTDKELIALLQERANALRVASRGLVAQHLDTAARELRLHNERLHLNTITSSHNVEDYGEWMRAGAMLKATGYSQAFNAWKYWSEKSSKYNWTKLNEAWVSFPKPQEPVQ